MAPGQSWRLFRPWTGRPLRGAWPSLRSGRPNGNGHPPVHGYPGSSGPDYSGSDSSGPAGAAASYYSFGLKRRKALKEAGLLVNRPA